MDIDTPTNTYRTKGTTHTTVGDKEAWGTSITRIRLEDQANERVETNTTLLYKGRTYDSSSTVDYEPPCPSLRWPLAVGNTWEITCTAYATTGNSSAPMPITATLQYAVESFDLVNVSAGSFNSFRIRIENGQSTTLQWYSAEACGVVRSVAGEADNRLVTELQEYICSSTASAGGGNI